MSNRISVLSDYRRLPQWAAAVDSFLATKQLSPASRRTYRLALDTGSHQIGSGALLKEIHRQSPQLPQLPL